MTRPPLVAVEDLHVHFGGGRRWGRPVAPVRAVDGVTFHIDRGETLALVGESGSGKSTTGRAVLRLLDVEAGSVTFDGVALTGLSQRAIRPLRRRMQMVFQDPYSSLDQSMVVADIVGQPLELHDGLRGDARDQRVGELLEQVGLHRSHLERYPYEFSGGQRQRIAIARAIAVQPDLVVCDEPTSALDVATQNQIMRLLERLQADKGLSYLFISHDLAVVRHLAHRVAVMHLGRIVEVGPTERVFTRPAHPYTEALLSAVPIPDPTRQRNRRRIVLAGDMPDPAHPPAGCRFHRRCPYAAERCRTADPAHHTVSGGGSSACLYVDGGELRPPDRHDRVTTART